MKTTNKMTSSSATFVAFAFLTYNASAVVIAITNPSFEDPFIATQDTGVIGAPGWIISGSGSGGSFRTTLTSPNATDGLNVAFSSRVNFSQTLTTTLEPSTNYILRVDVGDRPGLLFPGYQVRLFAGAILLSEDDNSLAPNSGFLTSSVTFTSPSGGPAIGDFLRIELNNPGITSGPQIFWDNVRLETTAVPESSTALLAAGAIAALAGLRRRNQ